MVDELLSGKRAIVTGGSGGIGSAIVTGLHARGVEVAAIGRSGRVHDVVAALSPEGPRAVAIEADLANRAACEEAFAQALEQIGDLDILVTAHGHVRPQSSSSVDDADWELTLSTNLTSVFMCSLGRVSRLGVLCDHFGLSQPAIFPQLSLHALSQTHGRHAHLSTSAGASS